jgi:hypothetical protein
MAVTETQTTVEDAIEIADLTQTGRQDAAGPEPEAESRSLDKAMYLKLISAGFSFFVAGVNDGAIGALIPYFIRDYNVTTAIVSSV